MDNDEKSPGPDNTSPKFHYSCHSSCDPSCSGRTIELVNEHPCPKDSKNDDGAQLKSKEFLFSSPPPPPPPSRCPPSLPTYANTSTSTPVPILF